MSAAQLTFLLVTGKMHVARDLDMQSTESQPTQISNSLTSRPANLVVTLLTIMDSLHTFVVFRQRAF